MIKAKQLERYLWELPMEFVPGMNVPGRIYADEKMMKVIQTDGSLIQVANAATLPGVMKASLAMPDIHYGYGFPIGGIVAMDLNAGVISPGGVGFDINCGVRLLTSQLLKEQVLPKLRPLIEDINRSVPTGVGAGGKLKLTKREIIRILHHGSRWAVDKGYGNQDDLIYTESEGCMDGSLPEEISSHAIERGCDQIGTLGSGNHFIEVQYVDEILDRNAADIFGFKLDMVTVMIHSGSRGLGHQVCTDFLKIMSECLKRYSIKVPDRQLACAPIQSKEGQKYFGALKGAANFAWANRQCLSHWVRDVFSRQFSREGTQAELKLLYDVAHNIVKIENHLLDGKLRAVAVHRKGATRAFGPGQKEIPGKYRSVGQPVIIPGDMGTASYVMVGTNYAMERTFGSACHGAGRILSRKAAKKAASGRSIQTELEKMGVIVRAAGKRTIDEEMPDAYKEIEEVVKIIQGAGIAKAVVRLKPLGVIKG